MSMQPQGRTIAPIVLATAFAMAGLCAGDDSGKVAGLTPPAARDCRPTLQWIRDRPAEDSFTYSTTYYVSPEGSDTNSGASEAPFATIQHAADLAKPGTKVQVLAGLYNEAVKITNSGETGKPITFEGEIGPDGECRTMVNPAKPLRGWVPAPEIGEGVYKLSDPGAAQMELESGYAKIPRVNDRWMQQSNYFGMTGFDAMALKPDAVLSALKIKGSARTRLAKGDTNSVPLKFWDVTGAVFGCSNGTAYVRFRNGNDPNTMDVRAAPRGAAVSLAGASHIVIRGFFIGGAEIGVAIASNACDNVIEKNIILNGRVRLQVTGEASRNCIRYNELKANFLSDYRPGAWGEQFRKPGPHYFTSARQAMYLLYKFLFGIASSDDYACALYGCTGAGNEIYGNHLHDGLVGITGGGAPGKPLRDFKVHHNVIHNFSSVGTSVYVHQLNSEYFANLYYDCNINMRIHCLHQEGDTIRNHKIYGNCFYNPNGIGTHHHFHFARYDQDEPVSMYFYHNSYAGGERGITGIRISPPDASRLPGVLFLNNVFSANILLFVNQDTVDRKGALGPFDYNWVGGLQWHGTPPWFGKANILAPGRKLWDDSHLPDFLLAEDSPCRHAGLDVSRPFTLDGKTYEPLPGLTPPGGEGARPDIGAVQYGEKPFFLEFLKELPIDPRAHVDKPWDAGSSVSGGL